jgi:dienelactone hydrolase
MAQTIASDLEYSFDGTRMIGRRFAPVGAGDVPGVLVIHAAHGLGDQVLGCAERVAALGYAVLAIDLWGDRKQITNPAEIGPMLGAFNSNPEMWMGRIEAARKALIASGNVDADRVAVMGYCFGGSSSIEFVRSGASIAGAVSFHGGLDNVGDDFTRAAMDARVLILTGAEDPLASAADLARIETGMSAVGLNWETNVYANTKHGFTEPDLGPRPPFAAYNAIADRRSWSAMSAFFADLFAH